MEQKEFQIFEIPLGESAAAAIENMNTGRNIFDVETTSPVPISNAPTDLRGYVPWGDDNLRPNDVVELRRKDEVMSSNIFFNILAGYGAGVTLRKPNATGKTDEKVTNKEVLDFFKYNRSVKYMLEQQTDMKHFFFTVSVIILNGEGTKIVKLRHKEAIYCRFETCNPDNGKIEHVYYGNWQKGAPDISKLEVIELLDPSDPLGDLEVRMGRLPNDNGEVQEPTSERKFAIVNMIPIPGQKYYPFPYSWAVFNSGWYDIKQLIAVGKKMKFINGMVIKYQVEINKQYWTELFATERITDPAKQIERANEVKGDIKRFLIGMQNAGTVWFSGFYMSPDGKEQSMIRINTINTNKEGGDWIDDTEEASNMECYADSIHPNLIGATPGKSGSSMSGTDKRELFTIKQALEVPLRQILLEPYYVIVNYNGWANDVEIDIPFMQLTTLDQGTSAKQVTANPTN